jgi:hypothetical protein
MFMKRVVQSLIGGLIVMTVFAVFFVLGGGSFFKWAMAWPVLMLHPFFPPPAPDQVFPHLGSWTGIFTTLGVATVNYSILIYSILWFGSRLSHEHFS